MIVAETGEGYRFVTQPDHAALAGRFADRWGNDAFEPPEPAPAVTLAAYRHDDGWRAFDRQPRLDDDGEPVDFREMPADVWTDLYDEGIDGVVELDPYAGLLVSMHGAGLRRRRYGLSPSWPPTPPAFEAFVDREEARQARLAEELLAADRLSSADAALLSTLHEAGTVPDRTDGRLWRDYALLQAWDTLSLAFCTTVSPPSYPEIGSVPRGGAGDATTLTIEAFGDDAYRIDPYPFDASPLAISVPSRTVDVDAFDDEEGLRRAYYGAGRDVDRFEIRRQ